MLKRVLTAVLTLVVISCANFTSDTDRIFGIYADLVKSHNKQDIHGSMQPLSENYTSNIEGQRTFDEVKTYRTNLYLNSRTVALNIKNLSIDILDGKAVAAYDAELVSGIGSEAWSQADTLRKEALSWKIFASVREGM